MAAPYVVLFAVLGLCVGSFLNVVIVRVPLGESIVAPGSRCPACRTALRHRDNVPVVSWAVLGGRCRTCQTRISVQYPVVELLTAALWAWTAHTFRQGWVVVAIVVLLSALVAASVIDLQTFRLPDRITVPALLAGVVLIAIASYQAAGDVEGAWPLVLHALMGMAAYFVLLFVIHLVSPRGMGYGDVKLARVLGLYLGWLAPGGGDRLTNTLAVVSIVLRGLLIGTVLGLVFGTIWSFALPDRDPQIDADADAGADGPMVPVPRRKRPFPFGPALAAGTALVLLVPDLRP